MKCSSRFFLMSFFLLSFQFSEAQNFRYFLAQDSSVYQPLENASVLAEQANWPGKKLGVKLPFKFNCGGIISDSVSIERSGIVYVGTGKNTSLLAFNNLQPGKDVPDKRVPHVSTMYTGEAGSRIIKIEFKRVVTEASKTDIFNYQLWLYESTNRIEFHLGPNTHALMVGELRYTNENFSLLERINQKLNTAVNNDLKKSLSSFVTDMLLSSGSDVFPQNNKPVSGATYSFNPLF